LRLMARGVRAAEPSPLPYFFLVQYQQTGSLVRKPSAIGAVFPTGHRIED
jgi:hypothetical protein